MSKKPSGGHPGGQRNRAIDGLRAVAVGLVLLDNFHWRLPCGWVGVELFFVLSGWLITQILVDEKAAANGASGVYFRRFYFRRFVRIFPLYYAYLAALELSHQLFDLPAAWAKVRPWALAYVANFGLMRGTIPTTPFFGHLWTLSVEEQFYLAWPLVVWLLRPAILKRLAVATVVAGPLIRGGAAALGMTPGAMYLATFTRLDGLALGAVLALYDFRRIEKVVRTAAPFWGLTVGLGIVVLALSPGLTWRSLGYPEGLAYAYADIWGYSVLDVAFALLVLAVSRGELAALGRAVPAYLGRISYGLYLFHRPIIGLYDATIDPRLANWGPRGARTVIGVSVCFLTSTLVASASYRWFEAPLLAWRDRVMPSRPPAVT